MNKKKIVKGKGKAKIKKENIINNDIDDLSKSIYNDINDDTYEIETINASRYEKEEELKSIKNKK